MQLNKHNFLQDFGQEWHLETAQESHFEIC